MIGSRIGVYDVLAKLGEGGMGQVFRATDTKLKRQVAIKLLPPDMATDAERLARFTREAEVLASLNHPNIAAIFGLEDAHGVTALVMELVEGQDLAARLARGPLPLDEALPIARQIAEALEAAHDQGIIHRDLKPANIKVRDDGTVKVLDFGLAKAVQRGVGASPVGAPAVGSDTLSTIYTPLSGSDGGSDSERTRIASSDDGAAPQGAESAAPNLSDSPTLVTPRARSGSGPGSGSGSGAGSGSGGLGVTSAGIILGTAAYMAPEQARGAVLDKRADIWSFGVVLWEMLTGVRLFERTGVVATLQAVLREEPDWTALPPDTPTSVRKLLRRCLERDRRKRLDSAAAARLELDEAMAAGPEQAPQPVVIQSRSERGGLTWRRAVPAIGTAMMVSALAVWGLMRDAVVSAPMTHASILVQPAAHIALGVFERARPTRTAFVFSPDGRTLVFAGATGSTTQLFARPLGSDAASPIAGTDGSVGPFFSPSGQWIGFWADGKLKKVPASGGPVETICDAPAPGGIFGASWGEKDTIVFAPGPVSGAGGLMKVSASGGTPEVLTTVDGAKERAHLLPFWLPGESALLYTVSAATDLSTDASVVVQPMDGGARHTVIAEGADARYLPSGRLVYMRLGTLMAVAFDASSLQAAGAPVALRENVMQAVNTRNNNAETGAGQFAVSTDGSLAYLAGGLSPDLLRTLVWVDRAGVETPIGEAAAPFWFPRIDVDGTHVVYSKSRHNARAMDVWLYDVARRASTRLTSDGDNGGAVWSPDGTRVLFRRGLGSDVSLQVLPVDGGQPQRLEAPGFVRPSSWSAATQTVTAADLNGKLFSLAIDGDRRLAPLLPGTFNLGWPNLSADGRWLAYASDESGRYEVYVQVWPGTGRKFRISTNGGTEPLWSRDGRELFFREPDPGGGANGAIVAVPVQAGAGFSAGQPRTLFSGPYMASIPVRNYDVSPDGRRFLMVKGDDDREVPVTAVSVVLNWSAELEQRLAAN